MHTNTPKEFPGRTKAEWLEIIRADLKGKDIETLQSEWLKDLSISPFLHPEDLQEPSSLLPRAFQRPQLVQSFTIDDSLGDRVLQALDQGVSAPLFSSAPLPWSSFWSILEDVQWDMLFPLWAAPLPENRDAPEHPEQYAERFYLLGLPNENLPYRRKTGRFNFHIPMVPARDLPRQLAHWLLDIITQIDELDPSQTEQLFASSIHKKELGRNFYLELAALRAMRILAHQLQADYALSHQDPINIYAYMGPNLTLRRLQESMIAYTAAGFAAVAGGADFIHIDARSDEEPALSQRLARNIYHLFDMESHLFHVVDPAAGSYAIETLSRTLAQNAWSVFKESLKSEAET